MHYYSCEEKPFSLEGVFREGDVLTRMPAKVSERISPDVFELHADAAGGRVRFRTDSRTISVHAVFSRIAVFNHFPLSGTAGLDLYAEAPDAPDHYIGTFLPPVDIAESLEFEASLPTDGVLREYTVNLPLYSCLRSLEIGLDAGAELSAPEERNGTPVVYYGSSITQGGCASHPGSAYEAVIFQKNHRNYLNLGFSGSARGETEMAEYIAALPMCLFVMDYDHNAPTPEHLEATHERFFRILRKKQPCLPVLFVTRPKPYPDAEDQRRREIIRKTYQSARDAGDENVFFLDGGSFFEGALKEHWSVDNKHPSDAGFLRMGEVIGERIESILRPVD